MSIFALAVIGYLAGLGGSIVGAFVNLVRMRADDNAEHRSDNTGLVILFIVMYMIFTKKSLQLVKVTVAIVTACVLHGTSHPVQWAVAICAGAAFAFMAGWPIVLNLWNRCFRTKKCA